MADRMRASGVSTYSVWPLTPWFLTTPPEDRGAIRRPRIGEAIDRALADHRILVVSAPSGYGKSTALAQWARDRAEPVAWVTLSRFDGDADRIAQGVAAAASRALSPATAALLRSAPSDASRPEFLIDALAAALEHTREKLVIVVDQAENAAHLESGALGALAVKRVPGVRLIIAGTTPAATVAATFGGGIETTAIGVEELAFDAHEVAALWAALRGGAPGDADVASVLAESRGWPLAVRLAMEGTTQALTRDLDDFVQENVLTGLPTALVDVIRSTSIVGLLDAELAVAVSGCPEAALQLEDCVQRGLFLDRFSRDGRRVYAWHDAFRKAVLSNELRRDPRAVAGLHLRAARHLEAAAPLAAVDHFVSAGRPDEAYRLLLESWLEILQTGRVRALDRAFAALPREFADRSAALRIRAACAWAVRDPAGARMLARRSEEAPDASEVERAAIAIAGLLITDDPGRLSDFVRDVDDALGRRGVISSRSVAHVLFALGYASMRLRRGPIEAVPVLQSAIREAEAQGRPRLAARVAETLSFTLAFAGRFTEALEQADRTLPPQTDDEWLVYDGGGAACARGFVAYWRDDLDAARSAFDDVRRLAIGPTGFEPVALMYDALAAAATSDLVWQTEAMERLRSMPGETVLGVPWHGFRSAALAQLALARGRVDDAAVHAAKAMDYPPVPRAVAAEVFRRCGDLARARSIVATTPNAQLTDPAKVSLGITDALLRDEAGRDDAHVVLERALDCAVGEGILRPFAAALPDLQDLLGRHAAWGSRHGTFIAEALARSVQATPARLSAREQEILAYLRTTMTLSEIATTLFLSTNTVKTHVQSLYRKLGVQTRREAVQVRL